MGSGHERTDLTDDERGRILNERVHRLADLVPRIMNVIAAISDEIQTAKKKANVGEAVQRVEDMHALIIDIAGKVPVALRGQAGLGEMESAYLVLQRQLAANDLLPKKKDPAGD